jgi:hypothetical protein
VDIEQLADYVVAYLNSYFGISGNTDQVEDPFIVCTAEKPATTGEVWAERSDWRLFVVPNATTETKINRAGSTLEHPSVSITVIGPLEEVDRALAIKFIDQVKRSLKPAVFDGYHWHSTDTMTVWNPQSVAKGEFQSHFIAEWTGIR